MPKRDEEMEMRMTGEEHEEWHRKHRKMSGKEHDELIKKMGITEEEHDVWHALHGTTMTTEEKGMRRPVDPLELGARFLEHCVAQKWLVKEGQGRRARYYPTEEGREALRNFRIEL